jgi:hypothetical protein
MVRRLAGTPSSMACSHRMGFVAPQCLVGTGMVSVVGETGCNLDEVAHASHTHGKSHHLDTEFDYDLEGG